MKKAASIQIRLEPGSGVPVYRQIIDQVMAGVAAGVLMPGAQLATVRQLAVDLAVNPNTVLRAYKELEIRGIVSTQQGSGTFITAKKVEQDEVARQGRLDRLAVDVAARAGAEGFGLDELMERLAEMWVGGKGREERRKRRS
ncbi:MAG: GntR family transcriptional regulator [Gammaproteobacteria bacterium]|nr:GntR family transcriptional regulator [Gammaproteobacteria bacterium]